MAIRNELFWTAEYFEEPGERQRRTRREREQRRGRGRDAGLSVRGYGCSVERDDEAAAAIDRGVGLVAWSGHRRLLIGRYDVRNYVDEVQMRAVMAARAVNKTRRRRVHAGITAADAVDASKIARLRAFVLSRTGKGAAGREDTTRSERGGAGSDGGASSSDDSVSSVCLLDTPAVRTARKRRRGFDNPASSGASEDGERNGSNNAHEDSSDTARARKRRRMLDRERYQSLRTCERADQDTLREQESEPNRRDGSGEFAAVPFQYGDSDGTQQQDAAGPVVPKDQVDYECPSWLPATTLMPVSQQRFAAIATTAARMAKSPQLEVVMKLRASQRGASSVPFVQSSHPLHPLYVLLKLARTARQGIIAGHSLLDRRRRYAVATLHQGVRQTALQCVGEGIATRHGPLFAEVLECMAGHAPAFMFLLPSSRYHAAYRTVVADATAAWRAAAQRLRAQRAAAARNALRAMEAAEAKQQREQQAKEDEEKEDAGGAEPPAVSPPRRLVRLARRRAARKAAARVPPVPVHRIGDGSGDGLVRESSGMSSKGLEFEPDSDLDSDVDCTVARSEQ